MVDIQSATAEIRRGKKRKKQDKNIMSARDEECVPHTAAIKRKKNLKQKPIQV